MEGMMIMRNKLANGDKSISDRPHGLDDLRGEVFQDFSYHLAKIVLRIPSPISSSSFVHEHLRPGFCDTLSERLDLILNLEIRDVLFDFSGNLLGSEMHRLNIVACSDSQLFWISLHQLQSPVNCIVSVDHRQRCVLVKVTDEFLFHDGFMEDVDCVVSGSTSGRRSPADQARVSHASHVDTVTVVVVVTPQLAIFFSDTVDSARLLNCKLGTFLWGIGSECSY